MKWTLLPKFGAGAASILIALDLLLIFTAPTAFRADQQILLLAYAAWLVLSAAAAVTILMIVFRSLFREWTGWLAVAAVLVISTWATSAGVDLGDRLDTLIGLVAMVSAWAIGIASMILLWNKDAGLRLLAWFAAGFPWVFFFTWRLKGNLVELYFQQAMQPAGPSPLWFLDPFVCIAGWILPLSLISFIGHTGKILHHEFS